MRFGSYLTTVSIFPHVLSRVDPGTKDNYRKKYQKIKRCGNVVAITGIGVAEGTQLAKDVISTKLQAYGYKSLFAILSGPAIQVASLPFYIFTYGSKLRKFAMSATEIGAQITKGEMGVVNWSWVVLDLVLFGEPVSITEDSDFLMVRNETFGQLSESIEKLVD